MKREYWVLIAEWEEPHGYTLGIRYQNHFGEHVWMIVGHEEKFTDDNLGDYILVTQFDPEKLPMLMSLDKTDRNTLLEGDWVELKK